MMAGLDEIPLSTSAYLADTQHLSLPQHGAYLMILMTMWRSNGWIPNDERVLANICKISITKWRHIGGPVRALLFERDGKLSQKRLLFEIENALKIKSINAENGSKGGRAKALKNKDTGLANATISPDDRQPETKMPSSLSLPESKIQEGKKERSRRGTTLPSDWVPADRSIALARRLGISDESIEGYAESMRAWAKANANRPIARKADWDATFDGWLRREAARKAEGNGQHRTGGQSSPAKGHTWASFTAAKAREVSEARARREASPGGSGSGPEISDPDLLPPQKWSH
jgi:uncharacterized protein YdaU (DUF1376 family)